MASDNTVNIDIHTQATGDGVKQTTEQLDNLTESTKEVSLGNKELRETIDGVDNISEEARQSLYDLADQLEELRNTTKGAGSETKKLTKEEKKLSTESKTTARNLDQINKELAEAKRKLSSAAVGTKEFTRAQEKVNKLSVEYSSTMPRATKSTRNFGLAALEGSRAMEDLQYGVGGVLNNIPGLVMMLGGSAGLTAVISLLAVGMHQLTKETKKAKEANEDFDVAHRQNRESMLESKKVISDYADSLDSLVEGWNNETKTIKRNSTELETQLRTRRDLILANIELERAKNENEQDPVKKAERTAQLDSAESRTKKDAEIEILKIKKEQLLRERESVEISLEKYKAMEDVKIQNEILLEQEIKRLEFYEKAIENSNAIKETSIDSIGLFTNTRDDFVDGDQGDIDFGAYLQEKLQEAVLNSEGGLTTYFVDSVEEIEEKINRFEELVERIKKIKKNVGEQKNIVSELEGKIAKQDDLSKSGVKQSNERLEQIENEIKKTERLTEDTKKLNAVKSKAEKIRSDNKVEKSKQKKQEAEDKKQEAEAKKQAAKEEREQKTIQSKLSKLAEDSKSIAEDSNSPTELSRKLSEMVASTRDGTNSEEAQLMQELVGMLSDFVNSKHQTDQSNKIRMEQIKKEIAILKTQMKTNR